MVRALLAGMKTQTRRIAKHQLAQAAKQILSYQRQTEFDCVLADETGGIILCPYGRPGDRLWVRETYCCGHQLVNGYVEENEPYTIYKATDEDVQWYDGADDCPVKTPWRTPIFMPRADSRILLEITAVRCERLQDISEADAVAEGLNVVEYWQNDPKCPHYENYQDQIRYEPNPIDSYRSLWQKINGPDSWAANPWVWVVEFKRVVA